MNNQHTNSEHEAPQDAQLRQLLQSHLSVNSPSQGLQQRIAHMASQTSSHPAAVASPLRSARAPRAYKWRLAASMGMCVVLLVAGSVIWPRVLSTQALARVDLNQVDEALSQVATVHSVRYRIEGTKRIKEGELWFDAGKWRFERTGSTTLFVNGTSWIYDQAKNTVTVDPNSKGPFSRNPTGFKLSNLVQDFGNPGSKTSLTQQGTTTVGGRTFKRALLENSDNYETSKISLLVDTETDLPQSLDMRVRTRYGKEGQWKMTFSYNQPLSPQLFKPSFGSSVRTVNLPSVPAAKTLTTELARKQVDGTTIILRSLEVNPHGSVFLSYTVNGAKTPGNGWVCLLSDPQNPQYGSGPLPRQEDQQLFQEWWIPKQGLASGQKWQPRALRVEFYQNFPLRPGQTSPLDPSKAITFSVPVKSTSTAVVPPAIEQLSPGLSEQRVTEQEQAVQTQASSQ